VSLRYLAITRNSMQANLAYRGHFVFMALGNLVYFLVVRALWGSIYRGQASINGMSFDQAFLYLVLAMSVFLLFQTWTEWFLSSRIRSGDTVMDLIRPIDHQLQLMFDVLGSLAVNFAAITLPSILVAVFVFRAPLPLSWNLLAFLPAVAFAFLIGFNLDYLVGLTAFYTESIWGISMAKETLVLFLSGALIPLPFFPPGLRSAIAWLPFKSIYDTPLRILLGTAGDGLDIAGLYAVQLLWAAALIVLARLFFLRASRVITINGG
jgi:ABC-2 type transport system permease protein